jgi:hypothetical protein
MHQTSLLDVTRPLMGDALAIALSAACLIHCLAVPMVTSSLVLGGAAAGSGWAHWAIIALALPVSAYTLTRPHLRGLSRRAIGLGLAGFALLLTGAAGLPERAFEIPLTIAGGASLIVAHGLNWRHRRMP